jgi:hypothetical protein
LSFEFNTQVGLFFPKPIWEQYTSKMERIYNYSVTIQHTSPPSAAEVFYFEPVLFLHFAKKEPAQNNLLLEYRHNSFAE